VLTSVRKLIHLKSRLGLLREFGRGLTATVVASIVVFALPSETSYEVSLSTFWDVWAGCYLGMTWLFMSRSTAERTSRWALAQVTEPGPWLLRAARALFLVGRTSTPFFVLVSLVGLASAVNLLPQVRDLGSSDDVVVVTLNALGVVAAWAMLHTTYALHYAYLYYRSEASPGGLDFPGKERPGQSDFAYFSFTIGTSFAVSDVSVTDSKVRRVVLGHIILSFAYNTTILASVINLVVGP
jgi:uncharacterized membrane protein